MSLWPGEKLRYAETHFKFKLPWSLLFKPWPEIIFDMPFQVVPGVAPTLWIAVRDADRFPTKIESVSIDIRKDGESASTYHKQIKINVLANKNVEFIPVPLRELAPGKYKITPCVDVSREISGKTEKRKFTRWNLPGLKPEPLRLHVLAEATPKAPGFVVGEMHCHTHYSRDHVEFGATPAVFQQAAKSVGLDFVSCTDHAYDFAFTEEDYTQEAKSPAPRFQKFCDEVAKVNANRNAETCANENSHSENGGNLPLILAGEEVSAGNSKGENVHVTVMAPDGYLPGLGDCGRYWLENRPTRKIAQILCTTSAHCFAAHPFQPIGLLEKFIFRRGYWKHEDLNIGKTDETPKHSIRGIQFWNGIRDEGFYQGREFWINELGKGIFLLPIAGNDAHGDLNDTTAVHLPLFSLKYSRDHVFGKVRTAVKLKNRELTAASLDANELFKAFDGDNCYITDGPALWWERVTASDGRKTIEFHARNTQDFGGAFRHVRIFGRRRLPNGSFAKQEEICIESVVAARATTDITVNTDNFAYLRAECLTADGHFAMTSAAKIYLG
ncbi:MAG: hypothetical protein MJY82_07240 [Fibrobacter sp.]|nr:hypothetical protein [Fibrobacter sp.]